MLSRVQLRILAALFMKPRTIEELYEHWPRAKNPLRRLERHGYIWVANEVWSITEKGEEYWNNRLTKEEVADVR